MPNVVKIGLKAGMVRITTAVCHLSGQTNEVTNCSGYSHHWSALFTVHVLIQLSVDCCVRQRRHIIIIVIIISSSNLKAVRLNRLTPTGNVVRRNVAVVVGVVEFSA